MSKEKEILDKELLVNYGDELDKIQNHISTLRFVAVSSVNSLEDKDKEIERVKNACTEWLNKYDESENEKQTLEEENERLNNIINELENWLERIESFTSIVCVKDIKEKIKELKGEE